MRAFAAGAVVGAIVVAIALSLLPAISANAFGRALDAAAAPLAAAEPAAIAHTEFETAGNLAAPCAESAAAGGPTDAAGVTVPRTVDEVIGGDYTATLAVQASNLSSITLQIEGYDAWLRQDSSYLYGNRDTYYDYGYGFRYEAADLSAWNSATLSLANASVPEGADVEDYQLPISVSVLVDTPPSLLETYNLSQTNAEGDSGNALFRTHPTWSNEYALQFETLIGNALANCRITITAIYEDGTSEAGVYVIAPVADFSQRYAQYLDNQDVYHDEVLRLQSEGLVDEARAFQMPKMPALFTITRVG